MTEEVTGGLRPQYQTYACQKCFIAYSEQAPWSVDLLSACEEVLSQLEYNLEADYARKHFAADVPLRQKALELIANARYGIYDLSYWRQDERSNWQMPRNVMIELGIAITLNRPILLLRHASNRDLPLPKSLQGISDQILEFSGTTTLKKALTEHLPKWINTTPETAWWNRYCTFGGRVCGYREAHPQAKQLGKKDLACAIADGEDPCRPDFRGVVEDVLNRFGDISYTYLDSLSLKEGYSLLLCSHCQMVRSSPFAIYRITSNTPVEAFISIGISLALEAQFEYKIPKFLITENIQNIPSLLSGYEVFVARNDREHKFCLREFIPVILTKIRGTFWRPRPLPFLESPILQENEIRIQIVDSNPFTPLNGRLENPDALFDREEELDEIFKILNRGSSLTLTGKAGIGKSTLLRAVSFQSGKRLKSPRKPIYLNLSLIRDEEDFYQSLCENARIPLLRGYSLIRALQATRLLLLLDEAEQMTRDEFTDEFPSFLRGLIEGRDSPVQLLLAARNSLQSFLPQTKGSPLANMMTELRVGAWNKSKILKFIDQRLANKDVQFTEPELAYLVHESGGNPFLLTQLCNQMYDQYSRNS